MLCAWKNSIFEKNLAPELWAKMLLANQIVEFLDQLYIQKKLMK